MIIGYIGVGIVIGLTLFFFLYMIDDVRKKILNANKYKINFRKNFAKGGMPIIKLEVDGYERYFLLDSGASENIISKQFYDGMCPKPEIVKDNIVLNGSSGSSSTSLINLNLKYNSASFNNESFLILDSSVFEKITKNTECDIIGVLGSPFFNQYRWIIDFDELVVWINKK